MTQRERIGLGLLLLAGVIAACSPETKALKNFRYGNYENVIAYYKGVLTSQPNNGKANFYIAESYR